jgi:hypothetical protein
MALLASAVGYWFVARTRQALRQRAAVDAVHRLGGWVDCDDREGVQPPAAFFRFFVSVQYVSFFGDTFSDAELDRLQGHFADLPGLRSLRFGHTRVSDRGLKRLEGLTDLWQLDLSDYRVTDAGLQHLGGLTGLEVLHLDRTDVTDAGLAELEALPRLRVLGLAGCRITDRGLLHLGRLTQLELLGLERTGITDKGLLQLGALTSLESLHVDDTRVTEEGIGQLRRSLPRVTVERGNDGETAPRGPSGAAP